MPNKSTYALCILCLSLQAVFFPENELTAEGFFPETQKISPTLPSLFNSLDPLSLSQSLAFYELYPQTEEGKKALARAWGLLNQGSCSSEYSHVKLPPLDIQAIISLVMRQPEDPPVLLQEEDLQIIEKLGSCLANRKFKGHAIWTKEEILQLPSDEIDLGRGLLLNQFPPSDHLKKLVRQYEASLDLMALQVQARLPERPSPEDKIREINRFIFQEMQFRFPPHSLYAKDIDLYTFLPSVLDSRQGVCLGVSILYLCLAQRLDLSLEIITPPGHIYVRYPAPHGIINIETTARGIDLPDDTYLGINTRTLQKRTMKEVIGMAFFNQASVSWAREDYATTVVLYEKAAPYLPDDPLLSMFLGFNYLFVGKKKEGKKLLEQVRRHPFEESVSPESMPEDYLNGKVDIEGLKAVFLPVDETRTSILKKQEELKKILARYPKFRAGLLQLATTWLQLGRGKEAVEVLEKYHAIDPNSVIVEYYLAALCMDRLDYKRAWEFLKRAEALAKKRAHAPKVLTRMHTYLRRLSPEPS